MTTRTNSRAMGVLTAGFFTILIAYSIRYGYGMLLPGMLADMGITKTQAGVIYAAYFTAYTVFSPVLGLLSDRGDPRLLLGLFTALLGGGAFLMTFADTLWCAVLFFSLAGLGHSACWSPVVALVQRWVPDRRRGGTLGIVTLGSGVGVAVWGLLLPLIVSQYGWKMGWACLGSIGFAVAVLNLILVRSPEKNNDAADPGGTLSGGSPQQAKVPYIELLWDLRLWRIGISYLFVGFTVMVPFAFLTVYATEMLALPFVTATRLITIIAIAGMIGKVVLGIGSDLVGRLPTMVACNLLMGLGCLGFAWFPSLTWLYGCAFIFGLGFGAVWPLYAAAAPDLFNKEETGSVVGLWTVFLGVGSVISPVLCGWTIDHTDAYFWTFGLGSLSGALGIAFLWPFSYKAFRN